MSAGEPARDVVRIAIDRTLARGLAVALAAGVLLALTEAFGMGGTSLGFRLGYWLPIMLIGALWGHLCSRLVERYLDMDRRPWLAVVALTVVMSGPLVVMVWAVTGWFFDDNRSVTLARLPDFLGPVLVVTGTLSALNVFLARTPVQTHAAAAGDKPPRFLERLPFKLRGAVIRAVQSEDHYLRIHTDRGSDLILMRLSDALTELEGLEGLEAVRQGSRWHHRVCKGTGLSVSGVLFSWTGRLTRPYISIFVEIWKSPTPSRSSAPCRRRPASRCSACS